MFLTNVVQYAVVAPDSGNSPPKFNFHSRSPGTDQESYTSDECSMIRNVPCPSLQLTRRGCKKPILNTKKTAQLLTNLSHPFTPPGGGGRDPFASTVASAIAALENSRCCTSIETGTNCFHTALDKGTNLAWSMETLATEEENKIIIDIQ